MDKKIEHVAKDAIAQAKAEGLDDEDAKWMAQGAIIREARNQGVIGEELPPEMQAAAAEVVKRVQRNG